MFGEGDNVFRVMDIFYSLQGEGHRAGSANVFVRFAGCNLSCTFADHGFDCDTEWRGGVDMDATQIAERVDELWESPSRPHVILTGGEPTLQATDGLGEALDGMFIAMETNGTLPVPAWVDYVACCPKPGSPPVLTFVDEIRIVVHDRSTIQGVEATIGSLLATHYFLSPSFPVTGNNQLAKSDGQIQLRLNLDRAIRLVRESPAFRLSVQQHKYWKVP